MSSKTGSQRTAISSTRMKTCAVNWARSPWTWR